MIKRIIPLPPITKKNSQRIIHIKGRPCIIPSKQYKDYEKDIENGNYLYWEDEEIGYPVEVKCHYYMPTRRRVDLVNLLEATDDLLVHFHILEDDNSKIVVSHDGSRVFYDKENPRTEIYIKAIDEQGLPFE